MRDGWGGGGKVEVKRMSIVDKSDKHERVGKVKTKGMEEETRAKD